MSKLDWEELLYFWELAIRREQEIEGTEELDRIESLMDRVYYRNPEWIREAMDDVGCLLNKWEDTINERSE